VDTSRFSPLRRGLLSLWLAALVPSAALADAIDTTLTMWVTSVGPGIDALVVGDVFFIDFTVDDSVVDTNASIGGGRFPGLVTDFSLIASLSNEGSWTPSGTYDATASNFVTNAFGDNLTLQVRGTGYPDGGPGLSFHDIDLGFIWPFDLTDSGTGDTFAQQLLPASFGVPPATLASPGIRFTDGQDFPEATLALVPSQVAVPDDFATVQAAVRAVQNDADPGTVILASDGPFNESVRINESVILESAPGFTPVVERLTSFGSPIDINASSDAATVVELRDLTLRAGDPGPGNTINIHNASAMDSLDVRLERVRAEVLVGDHGIRLGSGNGGPNTVTVADSFFEVEGDGSGQPACIFLDPNRFDLTFHATGNTFRFSRASGVVIDPGLDAPVEATLDRNLFQGFVSPSGDGRSGLNVGGTNTDGNITAHVTATNNVFEDNGSAIDINGQAMNAYTVRFNNNTIVDSSFVAIFVQTFSESSVDLSFWNNIVIGSADFGVAVDEFSASSITLTNGSNLFFENAAGDYDGVAATGPGDVFADPLFVDLAAADYSLQSLSPAIDAGDDAAPGGIGDGSDFVGAPRIQDGDGDNFPRVDIGAFEVPEPATALGLMYGIGHLGVLVRRRRIGRSGRSA